MKRISSFVRTAMAFVLLSCASVAWSASNDFADIEAQVARQHDDGVKRLQEWIRLPSIAAEDLGFPEGPQHMISLLQSVGFQHAALADTIGVFMPSASQRPDGVVTVNLDAKGVIEVQLTVRGQSAMWKKP